MDSRNRSSRPQPDHRPGQRPVSARGTPSSRYSGGYPPEGEAARRARVRAAARRRARRRARMLRRLFWLAVLVIVVVLAVRLAGQFVGGTGEAPSGSSAATEPSSTLPQSGSSAPTGSDPAASADPDSSADPAAAAAERIRQATARNAANATLNPIQATDPDTWQDNADQILAGLQSSFPDLDLSVREGFPYLIAVNREAGVVTVYASDQSTDAPRYTRPYLAMICSGGPATPTGVYNTPINYQWRLLEGPCYGQYATRIYESFLFHSVPYYTQHKDDLEYVEFNKLGTQASLGCIRLMTVDVKWIYDNCPVGTTVVIYDDAQTPGPMGTPGSIYIDPEDESLRGWDPTDPDPANPWEDQYLTGTTIRSSQAWEEWDAAQADGRWQASLNPADLQGYSTDYKTNPPRG